MIGAGRGGIFELMSNPNPLFKKGCDGGDRQQKRILKNELKNFFPTKPAGKHRLKDAHKTPIPIILRDIRLQKDS